MNQYSNKAIDYYNYVNNNYNQPTFTEDANASKLYDPYEGFIRGNMFPNLYNGYKVTNPIALKAKNDKEQMLIYLDSLGFAAHDISLYLDLHPNDKDMIAAFKNYQTQTNKLMEQYEQSFGPLVVDSKANMMYPWKWNNGPWPWDK